MRGRRKGAPAGETVSGAGFLRHLRLVTSSPTSQDAVVRKWMVIGLVFAGVAGTLILLATRSGNPVEYHKREYRRAMRGIAGQMSLLDRWRFELHLSRSNPQEEFQRHRRALFECGYLEQREFWLSNSPMMPTRRLVQLATNELPRGDDLWSIQTHSNKVLVIQAERHAMKKWEEMVRRVDLAPAAE